MLNIDTILINKKTSVQRAVLRERGCMPARTFVLIFKCVARPNLCETPALAKPPPRCRQAGDSVVGKKRLKSAELQHSINLKFNFMLQFSKLDRAMEPETIGKNGASPKSLTSRRNFLKRFILLLIGLISFVHWAGAQNAKTAAPMQITNAFLFTNGFSYNYPEEYQDYLKDYLKNYPNSEFNNFPNGYLYLIDAQNPFHLGLDIQVIAPVKVKYVLYTYKKTFLQDGKRGFIQGIDECGCVNPLKTQADIDKALDKIYEFPIVAETASGFYETLFWDGYTDPKFTGEKYAVRDCLYVAAYNADTGELIDMRVTNAAKNYQAPSSPGIIYRIDEHKDSNGKVVKETLSGKVIVAYSDEWPIKKLSALITIDMCGYGATPISVVNQGVDALVANINSRIPGEVVAHITLTNPTVSPDNKYIKIFDWKDIKTEDGKDFIPDLVKNPLGYLLAIIIDMDEMTYTGIKNGSIAPGNHSIPPVPKSYTGIERIEKTDIKITSDENGFIILCPAGVSVNNYTVYDLVGKVLKIGNLSSLSRETITATELRSGIYFVQLTLNKNGKEETVTKKVIIQ